MNDKEDFIILSKIKHLIRYANDYIFPGFPKKDLALKISLEKSLYDLFENALRARLNVGNIRNKYIKEMIINVSLIDYYTGEIFYKKIIVSKRYYSFIGFTGELYKMSNGWLINEEKKKSL